MKRLTFLLFFCGVLFTACDDNDPVTDMSPDIDVVDPDNDPDNDNENTVDGPKSCENYINDLQYNANRNFAFDLMRSVNEDDAEAEKNVFLSPMSVSIALTMLYNGTNDIGKEQMNEVLHLNGMDLETLNQNYYCLLEELTKLDEEVVLNIANSVWSRDNFEAKAAFKEYAIEYLSSEYISADFSDPTTVNQINDWISDKTEEKIQNVLESIPPDAIMYLINAIYFNADWKYSFDPEYSFEGAFSTLDDDFTMVDYMFQKNDYLFTQNDQFKAIEIPYGNDAFSMTVVMPNENINGFIADFSEAAFIDLVEEMEEVEVPLRMPKFELDYKITMNQILKDMGMPAVFVPGSLENIQEGYDLFVSSVIHQTYIDVDEVGTEAAGVTVIGIETTSVGDPGPEMFVNRPFLFFIRDRVNNNVLFSGKIIDPSA